MALNGVTAKEVKQVLKDTVWRRARADWREEAMGKPKLEMTGRLMESECKARRDLALLNCYKAEHSKQWTSSLYVCSQCRSAQQLTSHLLSANTYR